jgi:DNA gyrase/topoisomerase IV subunit A
LLAENNVSKLKEDVKKSLQNFVVGVSSERGIVYSIRAYQIPECSRTAAGNPLVQV